MRANRSKRKWNLSPVRRQFCFWALLLMAIVVSVAQNNAIARQAQLTVCPSGCDHSTIQEAINAASDGDVIQLVSISPYTAHDTYVGKSLTIEGNGSNLTTVQASANPGTGIGRVFIIEPGSAVTLRGFSIWFGDAEGSLDGTDKGGGIWVKSGADVTLENIVVWRNEADDGGGIFNEGVLRIINSDINNNVSLSEGGGIYNAGSLTLIYSDISFNESHKTGGGIFNKQSGTIETQGTKVNENEADYGGGIYNSHGMLTIRASQVNHNYASRQGGAGIYNESSGQVTIENSEISYNDSLYISPHSARGSGIYTAGSLVVSNSTISNNKIDNGNGALNGHGGGLYNDGASVSLHKTDFSINESKEGGAIYNANGTLTIEQTAIHSNKAWQGGALSLEGGVTDITNGTVSENQAIGLGNTNGGGGGVEMCGAELVLSNVTVTANVANGADGGGISLNGCSASILRIGSTIIAGNTVSGGGSYPDCDASFIGGFSLIGTTGGVCKPSGITAGMLYGDPQFGGVEGDGFARSYPLLASSRAIDAGSCVAAIGPHATTDQRGAPMPVDGNGNGEAKCDMGSYEYGSVPPVIHYLYLPNVIR